MPRKTLVAALSGLLIVPGLASAQPAPTPDPPQTDITVTGRAMPPPPPLVGPDDFISPMGEPFRSADKLSGAEHWFVAVDADHDGRMTFDEFLANAMQFYGTLDVDHDEVIGPDEITRYETKVAPEVTVRSTWGDVSQAKTDSDGKLIEPPYPTRLGAGRYGYLAAPEPIVSADSNFDRGITPAEFRQAARVRFKQLDSNGDVSIVRGELPKLGSPRDSH